ncbi:MULTISPECIES: polysaccharide deacetylase family protein [unclassified Ruminococcus]|uniref:polysaccharide deacetylase family protein n=1 Tax=unclassified Ruminococcus TaxID=2608920 RepID=UPI00210B56FD|nr:MULTISPECIES: polysaccharide deacetylase family protein [unclassified Ruminococcus]MCQ4023101.1 polysaccharide deacetylase family protein [Ruminococcus sp. zg-924]MCQ4115538.1 polysaccharide deacetylase family protein [Ruminococcus sp. zg-921]
MKLLILTRKKLIVMACCVIMAVITLFVSLGSYGRAIEASTTERKIPIYNVDKTEKVCSISFDAAWGNEQTQSLLDILDKYKVKSTFFLVGEWVDKYPDDVKKISDKGHDVGNHSDTHAHLPQLGNDGILKELQGCNEKIEAITGKCPTLFRPPYGDYNNAVVEVTNSIDMYCVQWNIDSLDWKDPSPQDMVSRIKNNLCSGSIILMHNGAKNTPEALPMIIEMIQSEGYKIVPISEILLKGEYKTDVQGKMIAVNSKSEETTKAN